MRRHCPSCDSYVYPESDHGICVKCQKKYYLKQHLSKVKIEPEFIKRDYETEILEYIKRKHRTYATEIISGTNISKGTAGNVLKKLKEEHVLNVIPWGKIRYVELNAASNIK